MEMLTLFISKMGVIDAWRGGSLFARKHGVVLERCMGHLAALEGRLKFVGHLAVLERKLRILINCQDRWQNMG